MPRRLGIGGMGRGGIGGCGMGEDEKRGVVDGAEAARSVPGWDWRRCGSGIGVSSRCWSAGAGAGDGAGTREGAGAGEGVGAGAGE